MGDSLIPRSLFLCNLYSSFRAISFPRILSGIRFSARLPVFLRIMSKKIVKFAKDSSVLLARDLTRGSNKKIDFLKRDSSADGFSNLVFDDTFDLISVLMA